MKKTAIIIITTSLAFILTASAELKGDAQRKDMPKVIKDYLIENFDEDGDGKLSEEEREAVRAFVKEKRKEMKKDGKPSKLDRKDKEKGILEAYDEDNDGKLSKEEREALIKDKMGADPEGAIVHFFSHKDIKGKGIRVEIGEKPRALK